MKSSLERVRYSDHDASDAFPISESTPRRTPQHLTPSQIEIIRRIWEQIMTLDSMVVVSALKMHFTTLAPHTHELFRKYASGSTGGSELLKSISSAVSELGDADAFAHTIAAMRSSACIEALDPANFPACHRALLFFVWEMAEMVGSTYTDDMAKALSALWDIIEASLLPDMSQTERKQNNYFNRRAPDCAISLESPEVLKFMQAMPL